MGDDLTKLPVDEFLDRLSARSPTPGGGSATALAGAVACALGRMVVAFAESPALRLDPSDQVKLDAADSGLRTCDQLFRALVTKDAEAYAELRAVTQRAESGAARETAVLNAIAVPMEAAATAAQALDALDAVKAISNRHLRSDLGIAGVLLAAVARSSRHTVHANLARVTDSTLRKKIHAEIQAIVERCRRRADSLEPFAADRESIR
jgi:formiminotetrahydrofolate cyclodeaminase